MPGLKAFGRRWEIGGDDFVFPQITEAIIRLLWFVVILAIYTLHSTPCPEEWHIQTYLLILLVIYSFTIVFCLVTAYISAQGRILNPNSRKRLPGLLYARCPLLLTEFVWNIVGSVWISSAGPQCQQTVVTAAKVSLAGEWLLLFVVLIGVWMVFDPMGGLHNPSVDLHSQKTRKLWKRRLQVVCLCLNRDDHAKNAFEEVAQVLAEFFSDVDLVMTDIWAGLIILAHGDFQAMSQRRLGSVAIEPPPEWMNIALADRMMDFAVGVYGWPHYVWNRFSPRRYLDLAQKIRCCAGCRCDQVLVIKDNCCMCNTAALLLQTELHEADLFHVSFHNQIYQVPFVACADPQTSSIVVAIRGSLSLRDAITDMCVSEESLVLEREGAGETWCLAGEIRVHKGILNTAKYVLSVLEGQKVVEDLLVLYPEFNLVVTGHSLGAGVATVVALMLKPKYPRIRCFAFSPPGCVVSPNCVPYTKSFICSVIYGDDIVPRLSYPSMFRFRRSIIDAIEQSHQPKYQILLKGCYRVLCGGRHVDRNDYEDLESGTVQKPETQDEPLLRSPASSPSYTEEAAPPVPDEACHLQIPGRILFVKSVSEVYSISWEEPEKFSDVKLSSRMVSDHMPYAVSDALKAAAYQHRHRASTSSAAAAT